LGKLKEAAETYKQGLAVDPSNAALISSLKDVEAAIEDTSMGGLGNIFGPDMWQKLASNPKLSHYLSDPQVLTKLQQIQSNPKNMSAYMQDPAIMQIMLGLMGLDGGVANSKEEMEDMTSRAQDDLATTRAATLPKEEVIPEPIKEFTIRDQSDELKTLGTNAYKSRDFEKALGYYDQAYELDSTNIAVLTNKSAVLFEMEKYTECIALCEKSVEEGRSLRIDFKIIVRALGRMGSAFEKIGDLNNAIKYYEKSLSENRTADILQKLREAESLRKKRDIESYIDPKLSDEAREKGNEFFKLQQYAESVKFYADAIKRNPSDARNYSNRAASLTKLMALPEAEKDCNEAIKLDPKFVKAYIRKAAIQFAKREYQKCMDTCTLALEQDVEKKHVNEIQGQVSKAYYAMNQANSQGTNEEKYQRAMQDPEIAQIMNDPVMQTILKQMQDDPKAGQDHMKNPAIYEKIKKLINAGIISTSR
jgi:stress-induced-phosphoprotein 1